jgi:hypothetical protein
MAAGLGFKDFQTGEVLTAADVDGYLMQGIWVFANATARDAAVTSPQEGNFAFLKDTNTTTYYTGSAWTNLDTTGMVNPMTTTGDTIYSSSGSTPARLGIGTAGQVLQVNSGATAPEWATPAGGGGMTLISETVASASTGISFTSLGSYKQLLLMWSSISHSTTGSDFSLRFNNNSSSVYGSNGFQSTTTSYNTGESLLSSVAGYQTDFLYSFGRNATTAQNGGAAGSILIDNYTSSTKTKTCTIQYSYYDTTNNRYQNQISLMNFNDTTAITSLDIVRLSGTATISNNNNSTIRLYGIQ